MPLFARHGSQPSSSCAVPGPHSLDVGLLLILVSHIFLSMSGPIMLDMVKQRHDGRYNFHVPAMIFHAYTVSAGLSIGNACTRGFHEVRKLYRPDMLWRYTATACLFTVGDMLSISSMQYLDAGTSSLIGKGFGIVATVALTSAILHLRHTASQCGLVMGITLATLVFCQSGTGTPVQADKLQNSAWSFAVVQRTMATVMTSLGAVLQERLLASEPSCSFMQQQFWMACGALVTSSVVLNFVYGVGMSDLFTGFDDWRVCIVLIFYVLHGLAAGLMVKHLGALLKALCVPVTLGGCYIYSVRSGTAALAGHKVLSWTTSTALIALYMVSKARDRNTQRPKLCNTK